MKKQQIYRRLRTFYEMVRDAFLEEEPRDRARRTMREASEELNRVIYQRLALEHEYQSGHLDEESRMWCRENLKRLQEAEQVMSTRLAALREQYRKLMMQDLFYKALSDPAADCFEQAHAAIMELQSSVESQRTLRSLPRFLEDKRDAAEEDDEIVIELSPTEKEND